MAAAGLVAGTAVAGTLFGVSVTDAGATSFPPAVAPLSPAPNVTTFTATTPGLGTITVPQGVTMLTIVAQGGSGQNGVGDVGGAGGYAGVAFALDIPTGPGQGAWAAPGDDLSILVGGQGGHNAGADCRGGAGGSPDGTGSVGGQGGQCSYVKDVTNGWMLVLAGGGGGGGGEGGGGGCGGPGGIGGHDAQNQGTNDQYASGQNGTAGCNGASGGGADTVFCPSFGVNPAAGAPGQSSSSGLRGGGGGGGGGCGGGGGGSPDFEGGGGGAGGGSKVANDAASSDYGYGLASTLGNGSVTIYAETGDGQQVLRAGNDHQSSVPSNAISMEYLVVGASNGGHRGGAVFGTAMVGGASAIQPSSDLTYAANNLKEDGSLSTCPGGAPGPGASDALGCSFVEAGGAGLGVAGANGGDADTAGGDAGNPGASSTNGAAGGTAGACSSFELDAGHAGASVPVSGGGARGGGGGGGGCGGGGGGGFNPSQFSISPHLGGGGGGGNFVADTAYAAGTALLSSESDSTGHALIVFTLLNGPQITTPNSLVAPVGSAAALEIDATSSSHVAFSESGALPTGMTFTDNGDNTAILQGTPAAGTARDYPLTITAANPLVAIQNFDLRVVAPPAITSGNSTTFCTTGTLACGFTGANTFHVTSTGFPAAGFANPGTLPSGVSFTDNGDGSATLSGRPNAGAGGVYPLSMDAANDYGNATQAFSLTVDEPPSITSANSAGFKVGRFGNFDVTLNGYPRPALTLSGTLPAGLSFLVESNLAGTIDGTISGTPDAGDTPGAYPLTITAHDNGIGGDAVQSLTLNLAPAGPDFSGPTSGIMAENISGVYSYTVGATGSSTPSFAATGLPSGVTFTDNGDGTALLAGTPAAGTAGVYPINVSATDTAGTSTEIFTLTVDRSPAILTADHVTFISGHASSFTVRTSGSPTPTVSQQVVDGYPGLPDLFTFTDNGDGTATISMGALNFEAGAVYKTFLVADNGIAPTAASSQGFTLTIEVPPAFSSTSTPTVYDHRGGTLFTVTTDGSPAPTITGALPDGMSLHDNGDGTASIVGPATSSGVFTGTVTATNPAGSVTQQLALHVQESPAFTSPPAATVNDGVPTSFLVTATGAPTPLLGRIAPTSLVAGLTFVDNNNSTATVSGTPTSPPGIYHWTVLAGNDVPNPDGTMNVTQDLAVTVLPPPVTFTSDPSTIFSAGHFGSFTVTTSASPTASLTTPGFSPPAWLSFHDNGDGTATLSGTPPAGGGGVIPFTILGVSTDSASGLSSHATQPFTLAVVGPPAISSPSSVVLPLGQPTDFAITTTGYPVPNLTVSSAPLPAGLQYVQSPGRLDIVGIPTAVTSTPVVVSVVASNRQSPDATQNLSISVSKLATQTAVGTSSSSILFGHSVTLTATVSPVALTPPTTVTAPPSGTVTFSIDGHALPAVSLTTGSPSASQSTASDTIAALLPGPHAITASYSGDGSYATSQGAAANPVTVTCSTTLTGKQKPNVTLSGASLCLDGARFPSNVTIAAGTAVAIIGGTSIGASLTATNPGAVAICGSTISGNLKVSGASGAVLVGDPTDDACAGNTIVGSVTLSSNHGGVELGHNHIGSKSMITGNSGTGPLPEDVYTEIEANTIGAPLSCSGNTPGVTDDGQPNTVSGPRSGQCGAPGF